MIVRAISALADTVLLAPSSALLATGSEDGRVREWNVEQGQVVAVLEGHTSAITRVAFGSDDWLASSGGRDKTVRLWRLSRP